MSSRKMAPIVVLSSACCFAMAEPGGAGGAPASGSPLPRPRPPPWASLALLTIPALMAARAGAGICVWLCTYLTASAVAVFVSVTTVCQRMATTRRHLLAHGRHGDEDGDRR